MSELKPCPFCGGEAELDWGSVIDIGAFSHQSGWVNCTNQDCDATVEITSIDDDKNSGYVIKKWNTRTESTELEQLRKERDELERLADNLLLKCVESDSDIADSDAWHQLERKLKFNQQD